MAFVAGLVKNPISQVYFNNVVPLLNFQYGRVMNAVGLSTVHFFIMGSAASSAILFGPAYLKNFDINEAYTNLTTKFMSSTYVGALFWPPIHFMNYLYAPLHYRQLVVDISSFFFSIYLSYLSNRSLNTEDDKQECNIISQHYSEKA